MPHRAPTHRTSTVRREIAALAARMMAEDGVQDYGFAKRKAARQMGATDADSLPTNAEIEAELLQHLDAPFLLKRRRADDQDGAGTVPQQHLLDDQPGFNGLTEADVVGNEQIDARHVDGAN